MTSLGFFALTWTCMICGAERPDANISVITKPLFLLDDQEYEINIRYCNDMPGCLAHAEKVDSMSELRLRP